MTDIPAKPIIPGEPRGQEMYGPIHPEHLARLERAVRSLPRIDREIFLARRLDDMSYAEIAERTGLTVKQVERSMTRALAGIDRHMCSTERRWWFWPF